MAIAARFVPRRGGKAGALIFAVSDTGMGIGKEDLARLGSPFVQVSDMRGASFGNGGTGLGLAICKRLIERMKGKLKIESEVGKGSTFTVKIPVNVAGNEIVSECKMPPAGPAEPVRSDLSVLLVDDVKINRMVLAAQCHKFGIKNVLQSASGDEAMETLRREHVDVVFSDLWMPGMSGSELCARIRENHEWDNIPVVAVTADVEARNILSKSCFDCVLVKPITLESVRNALCKLSLVR